MVQNAFVTSRKHCALRTKNKQNKTKTFSHYSVTVQFNTKGIFRDESRRSVLTLSLVPPIQISNFHLPLSLRILSPMKKGSDNPVCKIFKSGEVVKMSSISQWWFCTTRSLQLQIQISSAREIKIYLDLNMFKEFYLAASECYRHLRRDWSTIERREASLLIFYTYSSRLYVTTASFFFIWPEICNHINKLLTQTTNWVKPVFILTFKLASSLLRNCSPVFGQVHHLASIHQSKAITLAEC